MTFYDAVFAVDGDAWEVADMLLCASQLVEKRCFSAVLLSCECECQGCAFWQWVFMIFIMIDAFLAEAGVGVVVG